MRSNYEDWRADLASTFQEADWTVCSRYSPPKAADPAQFGVVLPGLG